MSAKLANNLARLRRRMTAIGVAAGVGRGLAAAALVLLAWMWLDLALDLAGGVRAVASWLSVLCGAALIVLAGAGVLRAVHARALARRLDAVGQTGGQILTGVDLSNQRHADVTSAGLASIAIHRAAELSQQVDLARAAPAVTALRPPWAGVLAILLGVATLGLVAPGLVATQWARFTDPFGDHPPYSRIRLSVEPGNVKVVYGQGFDVRVTTDGGPVEKAEVVLGNGADVLPMFAEGANKWRATVANVDADTQYVVRAAGARSARFKIDVITVPRLEGVRVRVTPPAYTHLPPYEGPVPQGGIAGLTGTHVELFARSNRQLAGGKIDVAGAPAVAMNAAGNEAAGAFTISRPTTVTLRVTDAAGQTSTDSFSAPVTLLQDERPFVRLVQPMPNSFATPTTPLPVDVIAEDDYGLSRLQVFRSLNDSRALPMDLPLPQPGPTRLPASVQLPLATYGLKPGDVIKVYARVEDNDPAGPKGSESTVAVVRIISERDYKRLVVAREGMEVLESKYAQARRRMEALAEEIRSLKDELAKQGPDAKADEATVRKLQELADRLGEEAEAVRESAAHDLPFDIDKHLTGQLDKLAKSLDDAAKDARALAKEGQDLPKLTGALDELAKRLGAGQQDFQQEAGEPLEHLAKIFPLIEDEARFLLIHQQQKDLADRLASLKDTPKADDPKVKARMRDLEDEQRKLRDELRNLLDDIDQHVLGLPQDDDKLADLRETAAAFARAVRESDAPDLMLDAELGLADFDGARGHESAGKAEETLRKFIAQCRAMGDQAGASLVFQPKLAAGLGNTVDQLLEAEGLSRGGGNGGGTGGGYMARRSTLRNVGLYGNLISHTARASKAGGGRADKGIATDGRGGMNDRGNPMGVDATGNTRAAGESDVGVPARYRRRVGDYFRRVADEIGDR